MRSDTIKKGFERAPHRSLLRATGQIRERGDFDKPFVAVCNSYVDIIPGHVHLQEFGRVVKDAVREAGGIPFEFNTIGVDDGIAMGHEGMRYSLPSRELIADSVETMVQAHCFDAMVCIPNCDKIVPGMLMGAARANIPTIFVSGGPMRAGLDHGQKVDLISVFEAVGARASGAIDDQRLEELEIAGCPTCGSCSGMFTANSMNCLCEALGIALPGNGTILAVSPERHELARAAARQVLSLLHRGIRFRDIVTANAIDNAVALDVAMGGSTNTVLHVIAVAHESGVEYQKLRLDLPELYQIHFSSERKRMTTVIRHAGKLVVLVKGAPEWVLTSATRYLGGDGTVRGRRSNAAQRAVAETGNTAARRAHRHRKDGGREHRAGAESRRAMYSAHHGAPL